MYRIYTDRSHYQAAYRGELFDLLRPFWKTSAATTEEISETYGQVFDHFALVDDPDYADLWILPMSWNHYRRHGSTELALIFIEQSRKYGKPVLTQTTGDFGVTPPVNDVYVIRCSGYRSREPRSHKGQPAFIRDPLSEYFRTDKILPRLKDSRPVIGFCGQSRTTLLKAGFDAVRTILRNIGYHCGVRAEEPQVIYPSIWRRARALDMLESSSQVEPRFIRRDLYRAGARTVEERWNTALEFYNNIRDADYTLCLRGGGNFSVRLYETLAIGRIPIFINTDCILPHDRILNWKEYVVWIEESEISRLPEIVATFHNDLHPDDFLNLQYKCRRLWEEKLAFTGFFAELAASIKGESCNFRLPA